jgi:hypothetical protein
MIEDFNNVTTVVTLSLFLMTAFSLFIMVYHGKQSWWLYLIIPVMLITATLSYVNIEKAMGYPTAVENTNEQMYVSHSVGVHKEWIYVWAIDYEVSTIPRAYRITYTKENEKKLAEAKQKQEQGLAQGIILPEAPLGKQVKTATLQLYNFNKLAGVKK